eukprot:gene9647-10666_t
MSGGYYGGGGSGGGGSNSNNMSGNFNSRSGGFSQQPQPQQQSMQGGRMNPLPGGVGGVGGEMNFPNPNQMRGMNQMPMNAVQGHPSQGGMNVGGPGQSNEWEQFFSQKSAGPSVNPMNTMGGGGGGGGYGSGGASSGHGGTVSAEAMKQMLSNTLGNRGNMPSAAMSGGNMNNNMPNMRAGGNFGPAATNTAGGPMQRGGMMGNMGNNMGNNFAMGGNPAMMNPAVGMGGNVRTSGFNNNNPSGFDNFSNTPMNNQQYGGGSQYGNSGMNKNDGGYGSMMGGAQGNRVGMGNNNDYEQMLMRDDGNRGGFNSAMGQQGMGYGSGGAGGSGSFAGQTPISGMMNNVPNAGMQNPQGHVMMSGNLNNPSNNPVAGRFAFNANGPQVGGNFPVKTGPSGFANTTNIVPRRNSKWSPNMENPLIFPIQFITPVRPVRETPSHPSQHQPGGSSSFAASMKARPRSGTAEASSNGGSDPLAAWKQKQLQQQQSGGFSGGAPFGRRQSAESSRSSTLRSPSPALSSGHKRERSRSPIRDRSRSRSRSYSPRRGSGSRGPAGRANSPPGRAKRGRSPPAASSTSRSEPTTRTGASSSTAVTSSSSAGGSVALSGGSGQAGSGLRKALVYSSLTIPDLIESYNFPAFSKQNGSCSLLDLYSRFPNLYIPADFVEFKIDWQSIHEALHYDFVNNLIVSTPMVFENTPAPVVKANSNTTTTTTAASHFHSDLFDSPKFNYLNANSANNIITDPGLSYYPDRFANSSKRVKFNAKVIISCGVKDHENERIDNTLPRKLRMLCGKRKGGLLLLGAAWSRELDGGDPVSDRSCLLNTARRAIYAQSLIDIARGDAASNLLRLGEVTYYRPKEEIKQKVYPEQLEVTVIYLYSLQPNLVEGLMEEDWEEQWSIFARRARGLHVGPMLNRSPDSFFHDLMLDHDYIHEVDQEGTSTENSQKADEGAVGEAGDQSSSAIAPATTAIDGTEGTSVQNESDAAGVPSDANANADEQAEVTAPIESAKEVTLAPAADADATPEVKEEASSAAPASSSSAVVKVASTISLHGRPLAFQKPAQPSVLVCPMPLPAEIFEDATKKQEGLSLRMLPLSTILSYSQEDCSERIFEASIAGELTKSLLGIGYANVIADFLLAEQPALSFMADVRVVEATKKLRSMNSASKAKLAALATTSTVASNTTAAAVVTPITVPPVDSTPAIAATTPATETTESKEMETESAPTDVKVETSPADEQSLEMQPVSDVDQNVAGEESTSVSAVQNGDGELSGTVPETAEMETSESSVTVPAGEDAPMEEEEGMSEEAARVWRRRFVAACRWFDVLQERSLRSEVLQMIVSVSTRNLRRADVQAVVSASCGESERLRYEIYI